MSSSRVNKNSEKKSCHLSPFAFFRGCVNTTAPITTPMLLISIAAENPAPIVAGTSISCIGGGLLELIDAYQKCENEQTKVKPR